MAARDTATATTAHGSSRARATRTRGTPRGRTSCRVSAPTTASTTSRWSRAGYARFLMPITNVRDTLGDFVNQYTGFAQTTTTLGLANGVPQQSLANPLPGQQPGDRTVRPELRPLHGSGRRRQPRSVPAAAADQRSLQLLVPERGLGQDRRRGELLLQSRHARAVRHQPEHGRPGVPL